MIHPKFQGRRWRTFRVIVFISTGLSGFVPLTHGITIFGFKQMLLQLGSVYYLAEGALFVLGAIFYTV
jgi:adiponectin receptor